MKPVKTLLSTVAALITLSSVIHAQSTPPVKMGLWQTTVISTMAGIQLPPEVLEKMKAAGRSVPGSTPQTTVTQGCLTPEKWQQSWQRAQQSGDCTAKNFKQDVSGMSVDVECKSERGTSTGHTQINFVSPEKAHGTTHMEIVTTRSPQPIVMNLTMDSVYQGTDCKGISPDSAKVISH
jgi:Protein of unknown function (DUF3617)